MDNDIRIEELINSSEWKDFKKYCNDRSFIDQLGLFRYEDMHTNYLASLLDENNVYGYGLKPMKYFLNLINNKSKNKKYFSQIDFKKNYEIKDLKVNVRKSLKGGIPDLYITFKLIQNDINLSCLILLEAKLESDEHDDQCKNYYREVNKFDNNIEKVYLYLTLDGKGCSLPDVYESITYQDLIDDIYTPLNDLPVKEGVVLTIEEYLKSFNAIYDFDYDKLNCYPVTDKMRKLVLALWDKQFVKELWKEELWKDMYNKCTKSFRIFSICLINVLDDNGIKEKIKQTMNRIKDRYTFKGDSIPMIKIAYYVFDELINNSNYNINSLEDIDVRLLETTKGFKNLITDKEVKYIQNPNYYSSSYAKPESLTINNIKYYYLRFNQNDAENFINTLDECYPELRQELIVKKYIN